MRMKTLPLVAALGAALIFHLASASAKDASQRKNQWKTPGADTQLTRHSSLQQINSRNVNSLQLAWEQSTGALRGHEGQPIVVDVDGTPMMYIFSAWPNIVQALDLSDPDNPKEVWNYVKKTDRDETAVPRACCDTVSRGGSYADGKVIFLTLDGRLIALDAKSGKEIWVIKNNYRPRVKTAPRRRWLRMVKYSSASVVTNLAREARSMAYDLHTGKLLWKKYSTGTDADVGITADTNRANPQYGRMGDLGVHTFPEDDNYKIGGGAALGLVQLRSRIEIRLLRHG